MNMLPRCLPAVKAKLDPASVDVCWDEIVRRVGQSAAHVAVSHLGPLQDRVKVSGHTLPFKAAEHCTQTVLQHLKTKLPSILWRSVSSGMIGSWW